MNAVPDFSGPGPSRRGQSVFPTPRLSSNAVQGSVWLLDPHRIGHLTACLRALGVSITQPGRED